jgi:hypothetical protein
VIKAENESILTGPFCGAVRVGFHPSLSLGDLVCSPKRVSKEVLVSEELHHARSLALSVALGAAMGAAIGAATGHIGIWVAAGIVAYIAISLVGGAWTKRSND